jgi:ankyrin repeat protein
MAAASGHVDAARLLLRAGAKVNTRTDNGRSALMIAAEGGRLPVVQALLEAGADVHAKDSRGWTPLAMAIRSGCLQAFSDTRNGGPTPARSEAAGGMHFLVAQALLAAGSDSDVRWLALLPAEQRRVLLATRAWAKRLALLVLRQELLHADD